MNTPEVWKEVPGWLGFYEVSSQGQVRSLDRVVNTKRGPRRYRGKILKHGKDLEGRPYVILSRPEKTLNKKVHQLVLLAFVGPKPAKMESCHNDGVYQNNFLTNLRWDTALSNQADRVLHGTDHRGEKHKNAKLTELDVREIRRAYAAQEGSYSTLGKKYNVHRMTIAQAVTRQSWAWLSD